MKENNNKLDQFFEKAFSGFEESPPAEVKTSVFRRMLFFNTWRSIRKYVIVFGILLMVGGIAYYSGSFTSDKSGRLTNQKSSLEKKENSISISQKTKTVNPLIASNMNKNEASDLQENKTAHHLSIHKQINTNPIQYPNKSPSQDQENKIINTNNNNKSIQNDKINTSKSIALNSTNNSTLQQKKITDNVNESKEQSFDRQNNNLDSHSIISVGTSTNNPEDIIINESDNYQINSSENSNESKSKKTPFIWSAGIYLGHSLIQSNFIRSSEQISSDNFKSKSTLNFPSGFAGLSIRAEKRHLFFDFGMQYASFSEKISSNQLLYSEQKYQDISVLGQNMIIDTGGYWHYFYLSTINVCKIDSIWTIRNDTTLVSLYDTAYLLRYDTLKNHAWINTYTQFEFPINVGWMKSFGKVNLGISTGPILSLLIGTKGKMPYHITSGTELIATKEEFQRYKFSISWQISGIINYQFSKRMLIEFSPYYRHTLLPYKSSVSSATLRQNSFGLQLGLRYYF